MRPDCDVKIRRMTEFLLTHLMRGATFVRSFFELPFEFLLTHLMRGATHYHQTLTAQIRPISTHAPHARCDQINKTDRTIEKNFYSRTSCEVRPYRIYVSCRQISFLLTHLMRGATDLRFLPTNFRIFLLTHLMRGATNAW